MEKLVALYRWGHWIVLMGVGKTLVVARPKNLVIGAITMGDMGHLKFSGEEKGQVNISGPAAQIAKFIKELGGASFCE